MACNITLQMNNLEKIRDIDARMMSFNVEMTEVTGGTFWKAYTPGQIEGTEEVPPISSMADLPLSMQWYDPIDSTNERLLKLTKELGPAWVRVSGTWATKTYYDFDGHTGGQAPEGFQSVLTKQQWVNILDFVKAIGGKLLVSVGNCEGNHPNGGPLDLSQAKLLFDFSAEYGVPIDAAEFMNEPNMLTMSGAPQGYTAADYVRDQDLFNGWVKENYPNCLIVGPCATDSNIMSSGKDDTSAGSGIADIFGAVSTHELMKGAQVPLDVFSYHVYNGISERLASVMPSSHWQPEQATSEDYLDMVAKVADAFTSYRDQYCPGGQMWVTEAGDAGGGGDTWASTYLDVFRTINELGAFAKITDGVIFHNTLASSDYGFLHHGTFVPRPNYFAVLLWNRLMGTEVYESQIPVAEGSRVYCHSRKDGKEGYAYAVINNSTTDETVINLPKEAQVYELSGNGKLRSATMLLNGNELVLCENDELPDLSGKTVAAGEYTLAPGSCAYIVL